MNARLDGMEDRYSILIRFDTQDSTDKFYLHFNGRQFNSLEVSILFFNNFYPVALIIYLFLEISFLIVLLLSHFNISTGGSLPGAFHC
jgi:hypothetical protein